MKKAIIKPAMLAATALGLCSAFINLAYATAGGPDFYDVHSVSRHDVLEMREEPSNTAKKVGEIPYDAICLMNHGRVGGVTMMEYTTLSKEEIAEISKQRPLWRKVEYKGIKGWVVGPYLKETVKSQL